MGCEGITPLSMLKAMLDGVSSLVFAATLGIGVVLSAFSVLLYQGGITLFAGTLQGVLSTAIVNEMSAAGDLLIVAIGLNILEIKEIRVGNLLPGIFMVIPLCLLANTFPLGF